MTKTPIAHDDLVILVQAGERVLNWYLKTRPYPREISDSDLSEITRAIKNVRNYLEDA